MPTPTYTPLANITLGAISTAVTFGSIPATYRDLIVVSQIIGTAAGINFNVRVNNNSTTNAYLRQRMSGDGSTASASFITSNIFSITSQSQIDTTANFNSIIHIMDYSQTDKHKTFLLRSNNSSTGLDQFAGRWANTAAINEINLAATSFAAGSTFALYGIVA